MPRALVSSSKGQKERSASPQRSPRLPALQFSRDIVSVYLNDNGGSGGVKRSPRKQRTDKPSSASTDAAKPAAQRLPQQQQQPRQQQLPAAAALKPLTTNSETAAGALAREIDVGIDAPRDRDRAQTAPSELEVDSAPSTAETAPPHS